MVRFRNNPSSKRGAVKMVETSSSPSRQNHHSTTMMTSRGGRSNIEGSSGDDVHHHYYEDDQQQRQYHRYRLPRRSNRSDSHPMDSDEDEDDDVQTELETSSLLSSSVAETSDSANGDRGASIASGTVPRGGRRATTPLRKLNCFGPLCSKEGSGDGGPREEEQQQQQRRQHQQRRRRGNHHHHHRNHPYGRGSSRTATSGRASPTLGLRGLRRQQSLESHSHQRLEDQSDYEGSSVSTPCERGHSTMTTTFLEEQQQQQQKTMLYTSASSSLSYPDELITDNCGVEAYLISSSVSQEGDETSAGVSYLISHSGSAENAAQLNASRENDDDNDSDDDDDNDDNDAIRDMLTNNALVAPHEDMEAMFKQKWKTEGARKLAPPNHDTSPNHNVNLGRITEEGEGEGSSISGGGAIGGSGLGYRGDDDDDDDDDDGSKSSMERSFPLTAQAIRETAEAQAAASMARDEEEEDELLSQSQAGGNQNHSRPLPTTLSTTGSKSTTVSSLGSTSDVVLNAFSDDHNHAQRLLDQKRNTRVAIVMDGQFVEEDEDDLVERDYGPRVGSHGSKARTNTQWTPSGDLSNSARMLPPNQANLEHILEGITSSSSTTSPTKQKRNQHRRNSHHSKNKSIGTLTTTTTTTMTAGGAAGSQPATEDDVLSDPVMMDRSTGSSPSNDDDADRATNSSNGGGGSEFPDADGFLVPPEGLLGSIQTEENGDEALEAEDDDTFPLLYHNNSFATGNSGGNSRVNKKDSRSAARAWSSAALDQSFGSLDKLNVSGISHNTSMSSGNNNHNNNTSNSSNNNSFLIQQHHRNLRQKDAEMKKSIVAELQNRRLSGVSPSMLSSATSASLLSLHPSDYHQHSIRASPLTSVSLDRTELQPTNDAELDPEVLFLDEGKVNQIDLDSQDDIPLELQDTASLLLRLKKLDEVLKADEEAFAKSRSYRSANSPIAIPPTPAPTASFDTFASQSNNQKCSVTPPLPSSSDAEFFVNAPCPPSKKASASVTGRKTPPPPTSSERNNTSPVPPPYQLKRTSGRPPTPPNAPTSSGRLTPPIPMTSATSASRRSRPVTPPLQQTLPSGQVSSATVTPLPSLPVTLSPVAAAAAEAAATVTTRSIQQPNKARAFPTENTRSSSPVSNDSSCSFGSATFGNLAQAQRSPPSPVVGMTHLHKEMSSRAYRALAIPKETLPNVNTRKDPQQHKLALAVSASSKVPDEETMTGAVQVTPDRTPKSSMRKTAEPAMTSPKRQSTSKDNDNNQNSSTPPTTPRPFFWRSHPTKTTPPSNENSPRNHLPTKAASSPNPPMDSIPVLRRNFSVSPISSQFTLSQEQQQETPEDQQPSTKAHSQKTSLSSFAAKLQLFVPETRSKARLNEKGQEQNQPGVNMSASALAQHNRNGLELESSRTSTPSKDHVKFHHETLEHERSQDTSHVHIRWGSIDGPVHAPVSLQEKNGVQTPNAKGKIDLSNVRRALMTSNDANQAGDGGWKRISKPPTKILARDNASLGGSDDGLLLFPDPPMKMGIKFQQPLFTTMDDSGGSVLGDGLGDDAANTAIGGFTSGSESSAADAWGRDIRMMRPVPTSSILKKSTIASTDKINSSFVQF